MKAEDHVARWVDDDPVREWYGDDLYVRSIRAQRKATLLREWLARWEEQLAGGTDGAEQLVGLIDHLFSTAYRIDPMDEQHQRAVVIDRIEHAARDVRVLCAQTGRDADEFVAMWVPRTIDAIATVCPNLEAALTQHDAPVRNAIHASVYARGPASQKWASLQELVRELFGVTVTKAALKKTLTDFRKRNTPPKR